LRFDPDRQHRQSIRFSRYDYTRSGLYFVTLCVHGRECIFGEIDESSQVRLTYDGQSVRWAWEALPGHFPHIGLDAFVVMPNHVQGILELRNMEPPCSRRHPVPEVIRALKSFSARRINKRRGTPGVPVWQRNYYERILRDEEDLVNVRRYIADNPLKWADDPENPISGKPIV